MTLDLKHFIGINKIEEGLICMLTDGNLVEFEDGETSLELNLVKIRAKDIKKYDIYSDSSKSVIPVIKKKKNV